MQGERAAAIDKAIGAALHLGIFINEINSRNLHLAAARHATSDRGRCGLHHATRHAYAGLHLPVVLDVHLASSSLLAARCDSPPALVAPALAITNGMYVIRTPSTGLSTQWPSAARGAAATLIHSPASTTQEGPVSGSCLFFRHERRQFKLPLFPN